MLLVDIGNSSVKMQSWQDGLLTRTFVRRTQGDWQKKLIHWLQQLSADQQNPQNCLVASVRRDASHEQIIEILHQFFQASAIRLIKPAKHASLSSCYVDISRMGVDRWLALIGCAAEIDGPTMIIDAGSAITIDLLTAEANHLGGAILAGFNTSPERFISIMKTADFTHPDINLNDQPGCSTESCIHIDYESGDTRSRVAELIRRWKPRLGELPTLVLSGGDWSVVPTEEFSNIRVFTDLVFKGMKAYGQQPDS